MPPQALYDLHCIKVAEHILKSPKKALSVADINQHIKLPGAVSDFISFYFRCDVFRP
jgi:hypothetical protein